ncbi:MAG TPA: RNA polymerase sigma factor [Candidatus Binatia bacterium]|nr:RNA polymerase sigma factor [Candidatus Binatia bacterium]
MDEQDLIRLAAAGDLEAFERLVERKRERVFWIACHIVGDRELARDVTQEVFLRLYRVIRRFRSGGPFDAWLHRISTNLSIDLLRRERPHRDTAALEDIPEGSADAPPPGRAGGQESPAGDALRRREIRRIFAELASLLSRKQRLAFVLREIEGLSTGEVAAIMQTRESTVRNHVLQARRILQEELRRRYPEYCRPGRSS